MPHPAQYHYDEQEIERAITFLAVSLKESSNNPKPVLMHSIRVASLLWERGIAQNYIVAAILHDVVEDTAVSIDTIRAKFGDDVAGIVSTLTVTGDNDVHRSFEASFRDENVATIRAADLVDNSNYYSRADSDELKQKLKRKYESFMQQAEGRVPEDIFALLKSAYQENVANLLNRDENQAD